MDLNNAPVKSLPGAKTRTQHRREDWSGRRLLEETEVRQLQIDDVDGELGIEGCYSASLIPDEYILSLSETTSRRLSAPSYSQGGERGGMLHHFRWAPISRLNLAAKPDTVRDEIINKLTESSETPQRYHGRWPAIYEGAVLSPKKSAGPILAWATWTRSRLKDLKRRTYDNDQSVADVVDTIKSIKLYDILNTSAFLNIANTTLNFDTLNGAVPGAASILFANIVRKWIKPHNYAHILLYHHKFLHVANPSESLGNRTVVPKGNNDTSEKFFEARKLAGIGTRRSDVYAVRRIPGTDEPYLVLSTAGYMCGELEEVDAASRDLNQAAYERFC